MVTHMTVRRAQLVFLVDELAPDGLAPRSSCRVCRRDRFDGAHPVVQKDVRNRCSGRCGPIYGVHDLRYGTVDPGGDRLIS